MLSLASALLINPPWAAPGSDPSKLSLVALFDAETAYVDLAMGDGIAVGARTDGRIDVLGPGFGYVTETFEVGSEPLTSVALSEVAGEAVAVVGSAGSARVIELDGGTELCEIKASGHFTELATGTSGGRPVVVSGGSGGFGVWDVGDCVSHGRFAAEGGSNVGILTADGSAAAVFGVGSGVTRAYHLSTGIATGNRISLTGLPTLATTAHGDLVTALGPRLSTWDTVTGSEKIGVDLGSSVRDGSLAVLRAGERLLAATVDAEGTLRVCDLDSGGEVGEYQFGLSESPPLLGFSGDGDPLLVAATAGRVSVFRLP